MIPKYNKLIIYGFIEKDNTITFNTSEGEFVGTIEPFLSEFFISFRNYHNGFLFKRAGISQQDLFRQVFGSSCSGDWPWCSSKQDVLKLAEALVTKSILLNSNEI